MPGDQYLPGDQYISLNYAIVGIGPTIVTETLTFPNVCNTQVYQLDPASKVQTLWPNAGCGSDGLFISTETTGTFMIYYFQSEESAQSAPASISANH